MSDGTRPQPSTALWRRTAAPSLCTLQAPPLRATAMRGELRGTSPWRLRRCHWWLLCPGLEVDGARPYPTPAAPRHGASRVMTLLLETSPADRGLVLPAEGALPMASQPASSRLGRDPTSPRWSWRCPANDPSSSRDDLAEWAALFHHRCRSERRKSVLCRPGESAERMTILACGQTVRTLITRYCDPLSLVRLGHAELRLSGARLAFHEGADTSEVQSETFNVGRGASSNPNEIDRLIAALTAVRSAKSPTASRRQRRSVDTRGSTHGGQARLRSRCSNPPTGRICRRSSTSDRRAQRGGTLPRSLR